MKKIIYLLIATLFLTKAEAQQIIVNTMANDGQEILLKADAEAKIKCFAGKQVSDTAYLMWKVQDMSRNGTFIIYRSNDGKDFNIVGTKKAVGVPVHNEIAYYIKDTYSGELVRYYRIVYISETSEYLVSDKLMMSSNETRTFAGIIQKAK